LPNNHTGVLRRGVSLVVRHQRILWWVFAVNLVLGGLGASSTARLLGSALHHSLAGEKLTNNFDVGMFLELVSQPDVKLFSHAGGIFLFACLYFLFLLFIAPGVTSVYLEDGRLTTGEFFQAAGTFFWAFVRLALWSLIPVILVNLLHEGVHSGADYIGDRAVADQTGFYLLVIGSIPVLLLLVWVRLWFDLAQVRAVAVNERKTRRDVAHTFGLALRRTWYVYGSYILIGVLVWVVTAVALLIWTKLPGRAVLLTFLLLEVIMLAHIFGRLWQKACATTWYRLNPEPMTPVVEPLRYDPLLPTSEARPESSVPDVDVPLSPEIEAAPDDGREPRAPSSI
jgi:hypothetical protein